ncbi:MAG TPA: hypothetical protein VEC12_12260 [Bacteroidia bacterium]|nr:hypothetical protein [Bacteroidia bacterium]
MVIAAVCSYCFLLGQVISIEGYYPLQPDIDTYYAPGYNEKVLNSLKIGNDTSEIIKKLGQPFSKQKIGSTRQLWYYTSDGKCKTDDYAWLGRELMINDQGKISSINRPVHYD